MIPLIVYLFDQLGKALYFTKLDLCSRYYQGTRTQDNKHNKLQVLRIPCHAIWPYQCTRYFLHTYEQGAPIVSRSICGRVLRRHRGL